MIIARGQVELSIRVIIIVIGVNKLKHDNGNCWRSGRSILVIIIVFGVNKLNQRQLQYNPVPRLMYLYLLTPDLNVAVVHQLGDHGHTGPEHSAASLEHNRRPQRTPTVRRSRI